MLEIAMRFIRSMILLFAFASPAMADRVTYYHNDFVGSPVAATDETGKIVWREDFLPYGSRRIDDPNSEANQIWFASRHQDATSGLVYMGARYYDPVIGRFLAPDPVRYSVRNIHSFNRYAYANNNPLRYVDPDGRFTAQAAATVLIIGGGTLAAVNSVNNMSAEQRVAVANGLLGVLNSGGFGLVDLPRRLILGVLSEAAGDKPAEKPSLVDEQGKTHILDGDEDGGGHRYPGKPGKTLFPTDWSDDKILGEISDVATDPASSRKLNPDGSTKATGTKDGVKIDAIVSPEGRIVSGYPKRGPRGQ
jgi:RHS repeat-associated protein